MHVLSLPPAFVLSQDQTLKLTSLECTENQIGPPRLKFKTRQTHDYRSPQYKNQPTPAPNQEPQRYALNRPTPVKTKPDTTLSRRPRIPSYLFTLSKNRRRRNSAPDKASAAWRPAPAALRGPGYRPPNGSCQTLCCKFSARECRAPARPPARPRQSDRELRHPRTVNLPLTLGFLGKEAGLVIDISKSAQHLDDLIQNRAGNGPPLHRHFTRHARRRLQGIGRGAGQRSGDSKREQRFAGFCRTCTRRQR